MEYATHNGTYQFAKKFSAYRDFYIQSNGLIFSKLGLGTFNIEPIKRKIMFFIILRG